MSIHLPLDPSLREQLDVDAMWDAFYNVWEGRPFGYSNFLASGVDTADSNFPEPLSPDFIILLAQLL